MDKQPFAQTLQVATRRILLSVGLVIGLSACVALPGVSYAGADAWQEVVLLHDGQKILVERSQTYGGSHEIGQRPAIKVLSIHFKLPISGKQFSWASEYDERIQIADLKLAALHVLADTPYLVAVPNCNSYNKFGRPNPPYVVLKNEAGKWNRITLEELPLEFKDTNLVVESLGNSATLAQMGKVSAAMVTQLNSQMRQPEYRSIVREQMKPSVGVTGCSIARDIRSELIAPDIDGKTIYFNWWPLAKDWMRKTYGATE